MGGNKNATFYDVQRDFYKYWDQRYERTGAKPGKGLGYKVFKRWETLMKPRVFPSGDLSLPSSNYQNFITWKAANRHLFTQKKERAGNWIEVGPLTRPSGYDAGVGRVDFLKFDPTNSDIMYASTPDGGLWKTTNGSAASPHWTTNNDYLAVIGCSDMVIHPTNTKIMYLATGSWESDKKSIGVLKTTDGGVSWLPTALSFVISDKYVIRRLIMDPTDPLVMLAATDGGVYRTTDGWQTQSITSLDGSHNIDDITFKPGDHNILYASGKSATHVFWKSTDNGANWTPISSGLPPVADVSRIILGVTPDSANVVYALAGNPTGGYKGLYKSSNGGNDFTTRSTTPNILSSDNPPAGDGGQASHDLAIAVSPTHADSLIIGGISQFRSVDGGVNWTLFTYWYGYDPLYPSSGDPVAPYVHADIQSIQYLPGNHNTIIATSDGGISRSVDNGLTWTYIANDIRVAQQTDFSFAADDAIMIAGLQDIGNIKNTGSVWAYIGGGDGESNFVDYSNHDHIVVSDPNGNHSFSPDAGINRYTLNDNGLPAGTEFFSPIIQDPITATTCYAGGRPDLYKCENFADAVSNNHTWVSIGTPSGTGSIVRFAIYPGNSSIIYTIKENAVSRTTDGGMTWTDATGGLPVGSAYMSNIAISNTDPDKVWIVFSGYNTDTKVYKTTDGGTTWTDVHSAALPNLPINTIVYLKNDPNDAVYIGADIGIYYTNNTLTNWIPYFNDMANTKVTDLEIYYPTSKLRASTYGRGLWESTVYDASGDCSTTVTNTLDDGLGSLRRAVACAVDGATIGFDPSLVDGIGSDTIKLTSGEIKISKNLNIHQTSGTVSIVKAIGPTGPIFRIEGSKTLSLKYVDLYAATNLNNRALLNNGNLIMENVTIHEKNGIMGTGTTFTNLGNVSILGNVNVVVDP
ncbi:MAG: hypothetical protein KA767_02240 [Saprospiraceae bacterium]|nr:hypothetical protein [Saprospiraceae bacterium]